MVIWNGFMTAFRKIIGSVHVRQGSLECSEADRKLGIFSSERPRKNDLSNFPWHPSTSCSLRVSVKISKPEKRGKKWLSSGLIGWKQILTPHSMLLSASEPYGAQWKLIRWGPAPWSLQRWDKQCNWFTTLSQISTAVWGHIAHQFLAKTNIMSNKCHRWTEKLGYVYNLDNTINQLADWFNQKNDFFVTLHHFAETTRI